MSTSRPIPAITNPTIPLPPPGHRLPDSPPNACDPHITSRLPRGPQPAQPLPLGFCQEGVRLPCANQHVTLRVQHCRHPLRLETLLSVSGSHGTSAHGAPTMAVVTGGL